MSQPVRRILVLKRPGGRSPNWYLRYWEPDPTTGKQRERWRSTGTTVRKHAEHQRRELERQLETAKPVSLRATWQTFRNTYLAMQASRKPPSTVAAYRSSLEIFGRVMATPDPALISPALLEDFADKRLRAGAAPATVNRDLRHLKAATRWAARRGMIESAPDFHGLFVRVPKSLPVMIPEDDFLALVRATQSAETEFHRRSGAWWRLFLYVAYYLGLRRGEALSLAWEDVRLDSREVRVKASTSKGRRERVLPLPKKLAEMLGEWRRESQPTSIAAPVLPWPYDTHGPFYDDWNAINAAAGLPEGRRYRPKDCRSSCASALIASNVPTIVVKDFLGHASVATTEGYYVNTKPSLKAIGEVRDVKTLEGSADGRAEKTV
jgi:integrase/recombinase XerC